ncbi:MAG TPA: DUF2764 family protein [bacterium]|nr:DUF2764 family protein [bacterium]
MSGGLYYLVSSLPYLRFGEPAPLDSGLFFNMCRGFVSDSQLDRLQTLTLEPQEPPCCDAASAWNQFETDLRNWTVRLRGQALRVDAERFLRPEGDLSAAMELQVTEALDQRTPVETEKRLDEMRWQTLENLRVGHDYDFEGLVVYRLKLAILEKWADHDRPAGRDRLMNAVDTLQEHSAPDGDDGSGPENDI